MKKPLVSIITPTYNRAHLVEDTIKSVLSQTYKNIEYIVVDGFSTDKTVDILSRYKEQGKLNFVSEKDDGMYYAINKGIKMTHGDIIAYLNSDDRYFPWTIEQAVKEFQKDNTVDMIFGDSYVIDSLKNKNHINLYASFKEYWLPLGGVICQPTVFLRRRVFEEIGLFDTGFKCLADCEFWQRVNNTSGMTIMKVDEVMVKEYNHDGTIRHTLQEEINAEKGKVLRMYEKRYFGRKFKLFTLRMLKEKKLWKFMTINMTKGFMPCRSWGNYLSVYNAEFNLLQYVTHKLYVIPSFIKKVIKGEGMI